MSLKFLDKVDSVNDLRKLPEVDLYELAEDLREFIIDVVSKKEGHLGSSLGTIELTIALHYVFNTPNDKLVWDVGHQAYGHKILTGRKNSFHTNREFGGISGFPEINESEFDSFGVGHSSTSISAALGMSLASSVKKEFDRQHIAVIGDASIASGMAFEGLNHAGNTDSNLIVILNDNSIGIDPSVGALKNYLSSVSLDSDKTDNIFESLNFEYFGPVDGHNISGLIEMFNKVKIKKGPKLIHVITKKGKGLKLAEEDQIKYHAPGKFNNKTGVIIKNENGKIPPKFQDVFGLTILDLAKKNKKIIAITPAMPTGSSLKYIIKEIPERAFDVGIAEQHAVTLAAGLASQGLIPFCVIYSTFLQRAYDQIIHDVAIQKLPVVFCVDRAGLVGNDGATHHGVFDIAYLRCIPNMMIFAPRNELELRNILYTAQLKLEGPIAIRYPRGRGLILDWEKDYSKINIGEGELIHNGELLTILCIGTIINNVIDVAKELNLSLYDMRFVKPMDLNILHKVCQSGDKIITIEDGVIAGGFGSAILEFMADNNYTNNIKLLGIPDKFIKHGATNKLKESIGLDSIGLKKEIEKFKNDSH
ncbi:MAG: 1-deoxy-D-xylulose-5-phosphate synthase [Flavobacteriaceae bacterium]|jgi:1-deoxy-D-xylulose-5-phosphate synthase|tara:strand:- start:45 stop:1814 length:1770 start_codon:yes stop_codon:yes gene_type:complete